MDQPNNISKTDYEVKLEIFEGPLDLLLHLIHKNEVDIFDIPIAVIADQYLEYLDLMEAFNIDVAGDFLVMASTLMHIKSKMLLPELQDEEEEDPRLEITRSLLEYMHFKELGEELSEREMLERDVFARKIPADILSYAKEQEPQINVNLFQLMDAFKRMLDQRLPGVQLKFQLEQFSVKEKTEAIITRLREKGPMYFTELFGSDRTIGEFVVTFLALLEIAHLGLVKIFQSKQDSDISLIPNFENQNGNGNE